jgi:ethanolamine ammonia-lyase small subunit
MTEITSARLSLGSSAASVATREQLRFQLDHAQARDAVHAELDTALLLRGLGGRGVLLRSAVAGGRAEYLRRPDLGRRLDAASADRLRELLKSRVPEAGPGAPAVVASDVVFVIADGLSSLAVERHALALLETTLQLIEAEWKLGPVCVVSQGRVAIGDEIGETLGAAMTVMLIGERPGLSAADSLGVYLTWAPRVGRTDAERNCISNIRDGGLGYAEAARRIAFYMRQARQLQATGVALKDTGAALGLDSPGR